MNEPHFESLSWAAFIAAIFLGGLNSIGVRFTVLELPPFWGAVLRFLPAAIILFTAAWIMKLPLPKGRALGGAVLYGILNFGAGYVFIYWGLRQIHAGIATVILALVPLLTLLLAVLHRQETLRLPAILGALISAAGVALVSVEQVNFKNILLPLLAMFMGAVCLSESNIIIKKIPQNHPVMTNAIGAAAGGLVHLVMTVITHEPMPLPSKPSTWIAIAYLTIFGTCLMFILVVAILKRWPASRAAYILVLMPFVAIPVSAMLDHETIGFTYLAGVALVLVGVYLGAIAPRQKAVLARQFK